MLKNIFCNSSVDTDIFRRKRYYRFFPEQKREDPRRRERQMQNDGREEGEPHHLMQELARELDEHFEYEHQRQSRIQDDSHRLLTFHLRLLSSLSQIHFMIGHSKRTS